MQESGVLLLIDNYDSFTYTIRGYFEEIGMQTKIASNALSIEEAFSLNPEFLVIGPGPDNPSQAGNTKRLIKAFAGQIPILGICLGHQAIGEIFGCKILLAKQPMHGKTSQIFHSETGLFQGIKQGFLATRYHSLIIDCIPSPLRVTAETKEGEVMAIEHETFPLYGIQFHPEALLTQEGKTLLKNFHSIRKVTGPSLISSTSI